MAELLVRTVDKRNPGNPVADAQLSRRGDVIFVGEDGHRWGMRELQSPYHIILRVPGVSAIDLYDFMSPEPGSRDLNPTLRYRAFYLDLDDPWWPATTVLAEGELRRFKRRRCSVPHPKMVGRDPRVLIP